MPHRTIDDEELPENGGTSSPPAISAGGDRTIDDERNDVPAVVVDRSAAQGVGMADAFGTYGRNGLVYLARLAVEESVANSDTSARR